MLLKNRLDGIGWFSYQTLKRITKQNPEVHFVFLFDRPYDEEFVFSENITPLVISPPARHAFLFYVWYQHSVKSTLQRMKPDLFLSPDGMISLGARCKQLPVIHDINFYHRPKDIPFWARNFYNHYYPKYAKDACRIATVSEYSKNDIADTYKIQKDKIDVVYNGINEQFQALDALEKQKVKQQFTKGKDYFLFVGSMHPRKNIPRLIEAFGIFKKNTQCDLQLVLCGNAFWGQNEIDEKVNQSGCKESIIFTGRLNDSELRKLMGAAFALTFVPYFEGFGIPLVEAMQAEIPILCSNKTSLPEIAEDAAIYADPYEVKSIHLAMEELFYNEKLREELISAGKKRKNIFSWDRTADLLWKSIEKGINS